jgi:nucleoside 2-deoxyribosyltransferase
MGFMRALGRPLLGYTISNEPFPDRTIRLCSGRRAGNQWLDSQGMLIEEFGLADNLMLVGAVVASGAEVVLHSSAMDAQFTELTAFATCVRLAREIS